MPFQVTPSAFTTEAEAIAAIEAAGLHAYASDVQANRRDLHWHDFDALLAIVEGSLVATDESGEVFTCSAGSLLQVTGRPLHTEETTAGRFVFGFHVPYDQLEQPINRSPESHPSAIDT